MLRDLTVAKGLRPALAICAVLFSLIHGYGQGTSVGIYATLSEYDGDLNGNKHQFYQFKTNKVGAAISFQQYINPSFNIVEKLSFNQLRYQSDDHQTGFDGDFYGLNVKLKYKFNNGYIFKENAVVAPFLVAGGGVQYVFTDQYNGVNSGPIMDGGLIGNVAAGAGILFQLNERLGIEVGSTLNMPLDDTWDDVDNGYDDFYLQHNAGLVFKLRKPSDADKDGVSDKKDKCPNTPSSAQVDEKGCPVDGDKDGVPDYIDKCPSLSGKQNLEGCPDKDNDNVADQDDKCPDVKGVEQFGGCPDSDNDGVEDSKDKCPNQAGLSQFDGCPDTDGDGVQDGEDQCPDTPKGVRVNATGCAMDSDSDGVPDTQDRCPTSKGDPANNGCPVVKEEVKKRLNFAMRGIQFETAKATLKASSYPMLDEIVSIMGEYTDYNLRMGGHTDSNGSNATNLKLSQARVDAVKDYLTRKGVDPARIEATGYGEEQPIATNKTAAGRAQNRRVTLELVLKNP
ncbi:OmpA family protein [Chryseolinea sp. T2]|uniref:OmpA family protein n=1 Tax=Chryseolinea sp. T2 TaxID=3129255 RepID=UPI0030772C71